ncbi:hypothetical protein K469DRAFT_388587 [Zopfia rhizophila CBS 207.26]|uniref:Uncharacterized protein n=1 Tax=Zopfia rhizophila CBS 207.26 TaxID=1314779 RepID=A0A6A6EIV7_9PEZI|nr:hypothetical protein K469DRAFT_388587 [Zopfia rhizophila CBS 207.26]
MYGSFLNIKVQGRTKEIAWLLDSGMHPFDACNYSRPAVDSGPGRIDPNIRKEKRRMVFSRLETTLAFYCIANLTLIYESLSHLRFPTESGIDKPTLFPKKWIVSWKHFPFVMHTHFNAYQVCPYSGNQCPLTTAGTCEFRRQERSIHSVTLLTFQKKSESTPSPYFPNLFIKASPMDRVLPEESGPPPLSPQKDRRFFSLGSGSSSSSSLPQSLNLLFSNGFKASPSTGTGRPCLSCRYAGSLRADCGP